MKEYAPEQLRNVGLFSHGGAGKTTLTEALLYQAGADAVWRRTAHLPRLLVINKLDRENADFRTVLDSLRERYGKSVVPLAFPIGRADTLGGVVDLLEGQAYLADNQGPQPIPDTERGSAD